MLHMDGNRPTDGWGVPSAFSRRGAKQVAACQAGMAGADVAPGAEWGRAEGDHSSFDLPTTGSRSITAKFGEKVRSGLQIRSHPARVAWDARLTAVPKPMFPQGI